LRRCHQISGSFIPLRPIVNTMVTRRTVNIAGKENAALTQRRSAVPVKLAPLPLDLSAGMGVEACPTYSP
jgi:hypothetical protein